MLKRDSKFELLRIFSMAMIILNHYEIYGVQYGLVNPRHLYFCALLGQFGVGIFVMISAYFLSNETTKQGIKSFKRVIKIWRRVFFYSIVILVFDLKFQFVSLNKENVLKSIFTVLCNQYWFVTSFVLLMLFVPILNVLIERTNQHQLTLILIILLVFSGIIPKIGQPLTPFGQTLNAGVMLSEYLLVGLFRKYNIVISNWILIGLFILAFIFEYKTRFVDGLPSVILSGSFFFLVTKAKTFHSYTINWLASSVFSSYLITENIIFRIPFWKSFGKSILNLPKHNIFEGLSITIITIFICILIDKIYVIIDNTILKVVTRRIDRYIEIKLNNYLY